MLRMELGHDDLQRVRVAGQADPLWELVLSLHQLRSRRVADRHIRWHSMTRDYVRKDTSASRWLSTLCTLVPQRGNFPDFLTPSAAQDGLDAGCEALACTPRARLHHDLVYCFTGRVVPPWVRALADGDREQVTDVVASVRRCHDLLLAPVWTEITRYVDDERAASVQRLAEQGVGGLLGGLGDRIRWDGRVLEADYPVDRSIRLDGRGLVLVPSYFCEGTPVTFVDASLNQVLVYPVRSATAPDAAEPNPSLVDMLGRTRAAVLVALRSGATTTQLAARARTSIASASKHATVLRENGLVDTARSGSSVTHTLTRLGRALVSGQVRVG